MCLLLQRQTVGKPEGRLAFKTAPPLPAVPSLRSILRSEHDVNSALPSILHTIKPPHTHRPTHTHRNSKSSCVYVKIQFYLSNVFISTRDVASMTRHVNTPSGFFSTSQRQKQHSCFLFCLTLERTNFADLINRLQCVLLQFLEEHHWVRIVNREMEKGQSQFSLFINEEQNVEEPIF